MEKTNRSPKTKDLSKMSYEELEKEAADVVQKLSDSSLALDEASRLYDYGKSVLAEMDKRLDELSRKVTDTVSQ